VAMEFDSQPVRFHAKMINSALHPFRVAKSSTCFGRGQRWDSHFCWVAGNTV